MWGWRGRRGGRARGADPSQSSSIALATTSTWSGATSGSSSSNGFEGGSQGPTGSVSFLTSVSLHMLSDTMKYQKVSPGTSQMP